MSQLSTLRLAQPGDAREIAAMSRDLIEAGLAWSWTPTRVLHFIGGKDSSVVIAGRDRLVDLRRDDPRHDGPRHDGPRDGDPRAGGLRIAAFAIMHFGDEVAHLNLLAVAPEHRRQGLGRRLMEWLTTTAIEAGVFRIDLELRERNVAARAFYQSLGFDTQGVIGGYYQGREAALRMSRQLGKRR